jgi:hypothetical protein
MNYVETTKEDLIHLMHGLEVLGRISMEIPRSLDVWLFGIIQDDFLLDMAKEAIADAADTGDNLTAVSEEDVHLAEIGVSVPISADNINALLGSGIRAQEISFVYTVESEGVREESFKNARVSGGKITLKDLKSIALADTDSDLYEYFTKESKAEPVQIDEKVRRTEKAEETLPAAAPNQTSAPAQAPATPAAPAMPKQTSQENGEKLAYMWEIILG